VGTGVREEERLMSRAPTSQPIAAVVAVGAMWALTSITIIAGVWAMANVFLK
jgi:hypothetical protein